MWFGKPGKGRKIIDSKRAKRVQTALEYVEVATRVRTTNHNIHHIFSDLLKQKIGPTKSIRAVMARRSPGCNSSW